MLPRPRPPPRPRLPVSSPTRFGLGLVFRHGHGHGHGRVRSLHDQGIWGYQSPLIPNRVEFLPAELENRARNASLLRLVESYRRHGHRAAKLDPLDLMKRENVPALDPRRYGFPLSRAFVQQLRPEFISETNPPPLPVDVVGGTAMEVKLDTSGILDFPPESSAEADAEAEQEEEKRAGSGSGGKRRGMRMNNGNKLKTIEEIAQRLAEVYCSGIGYEFMHLPSKSERRFLELSLESSSSFSSSSSSEQQLAHWRLLASSEVQDQWSAKRFPNVKRYGLEGAEGMMVALREVLELARARGEGEVEVVLAMPHRGRLNVLTQLLDLDMRLLVRKMRALPTLPPSLPGSQFTDDVLSHLFLSTVYPSTSSSSSSSRASSSSSSESSTSDSESDRHVHAAEPDSVSPKTKSKAKTKTVKVHFLPNPSHLETVNPVALGFARGLQVPFGCLAPSSPSTSAANAKAKDDNEKEYELGHNVLSLQVHGDAAFGGQGVVAEALNLANLPHFTVGGTVRIVVNNQLGYTTPSTAGRSSFYATDLAKAIAAPIIHVNGDRVDDVARAVRWAVGYQQQFRKDVIIDLVVYRRRGHNELDEPAYTSPVMYKTIAQLPSVPQLYERQLISSGLLTAADAATFRQELFAELDKSLEGAKPENFTVPEVERPRGWEKMKWPKEGDWKEAVHTGVKEAVLKEVGRRSVQVPDDITPHPRLLRMHAAKRLASLDSGSGIDFATAEALAFGTLMLEGKHVRLCGQDSGRGTFSQRHAIISDQESTRTTVPLQTLQSDPPEGMLSGSKPGSIEVVNSPLSEYAVIGFEQGISWVSPDILPIWEAQFGDFHNTAQVAIDTYFGSGETKWGLQSALTLLLPHGYDSAGPEHSSARIERFLQLTNEPLSSATPFVPNMHLVNVTTAANYFHLLRRQMKRDYRKPLVVFSPKGILRLPAASSTLAEMAEGSSFQPVIAEASEPASEVKRVVFLSGKMYYDLVKERSDRGLDGKITLIRIEEISPFPYPQLKELIASHSSAMSFTWAQEEPENAGAYLFAQPRLQSLLPEGRVLRYAGRDAMAVPAPGVGQYFAESKKKVMNDVFEGL